MYSKAEQDGCQMCMGVRVWVADTRVAFLGACPGKHGDHKKPGVSACISASNDVNIGLLISLYVYFTHQMIWPDIWGLYVSY